MESPFLPKQSSIAEKEIRQILTQDNPTCYLCGSLNLKTKYHARRRSIASLDSKYSCTSFGHCEHGEIVECLECRLVRLKEHPSREELLNNYRQVVDPLYIQEKENRYYTFLKVIKEVQRYIPQGKLLDVGCYCGYFLEVARESGYETEGLELSKWAADQARRLGFLIHNDIIKTIEFDEKYDIVTLWDVIEHFSDPRTELLEINRLLKKNAFLFISTINIDSLVARFLRKRWPWLMDMHIFYFSPQTITRLLEQSGFQIVKIQNYTHIISSSYFIKKLTHISPSSAYILNIVHSVVGDFKIPFNLGDNMMVIAKKV